MDSLLFLSRGTGTPPKPTPVNQGPLPPFNMGGNPVTTLPPNQRALPGPYDPKFWRGNAWTCEVPGLPVIPGVTSSNFPERCLTWYLGHPLWADWVEKILVAQAEQGNTHVTLGLAEALAPLDASPIPGCGLTLDQFVALCTRVAQWFDVHIQLGSKDFDPANQTWDGYWKDRLTGPLQALTAARAVQHVSFWEVNAWNQPGDVLQAIMQGVSDLTKSAGVLQWFHGSPGVTWWGVGGDVDNRFTWWDTQKGILTGLLYQINCWDWDNGERQARIQDTTTRDANFIDGTFTFVAWEVDAAQQFDNLHPTPAEGAADAYLLLCTPGGCPVNGASGVWLPDGTPTLQG